MTKQLAVHIPRFHPEGRKTLLSKRISSLYSSWFSLTSSTVLAHQILFEQRLHNVGSLTSTIPRKNSILAIVYIFMIYANTQVLELSISIYVLAYHLLASKFQQLTWFVIYLIWTRRYKKLLNLFFSLLLFSATLMFSQTCFLTGCNYRTTFTYRTEYGWDSSGYNSVSGNFLITAFRNYSNRLLFENFHNSLPIL